jgi:hypothetical protein
MTSASTIVSSSSGIVMTTTPMWGAGGGELAGGVDAAQARHGEVHEEDVHLQLDCRLDAGCAVSGVGADLEAGDRVDEPAHPLAEDRVVPAELGGAFRAGRTIIRGGRPALTLSGGAISPQ